jgi:hypothetical protein
MASSFATPLSHWIGFHLALLLLLVAKFLYSRWGLSAVPGGARSRRQQRNAVAATVMWAAAALALAVFLFRTLGTTAAIQFLSGYAIEETLSTNKLFVFLLLFRVFGVPATGALLIPCPYPRDGSGLLSQNLSLQGSRGREVGGQRGRRSSHL